MLQGDLSQSGLGQLRAAFCSPLAAFLSLPSAGGLGHCKGISALEQSPQLGTSGTPGYL